MNLNSKISYLLCALGFWLLVAPATFGYTSPNMQWSDWISGGLLLVLGFLSLKRIWPFWVIVLLAAWLEFAPLVFWAPEAACYLNDTLIGALVLILSLHVLTPLEREDGQNIPKGWSFNPSSWPDRIFTVTLALICWFCSRYMAAYQLGYIDSMWDPFFTPGTLAVITSKVSQSFPISDAGLGAFSYTFEAILGWQGGKRRWRTMPWMVMLFGLLVVPAGFVSILLIILQPVAVGAWCFWCLLTAAAMLMMIVLTMSEVVASLQFLKSCKSEGKPLWEIFWKGEDAPKAPARATPNGFFFNGISMPSNLILLVVLGIWLMFSPSVLGIPDGSGADSSYVAGPLIVTISAIAMSEVVRSFRYINIILGFWLIVAAFIFEGPHSFVLNNVICGILAILLSLKKGKILEKFGSWNSTR